VLTYLYEYDIIKVPHRKRRW